MFRYALFHSLSLTLSLASIRSGEEASRSIYSFHAFVFISAHPKLNGKKYPTEPSIKKKCSSSLLREKKYPAEDSTFSQAAPLEINNVWIEDVRNIKSVVPICFVFLAVLVENLYHTTHTHTHTTAINKKNKFRVSVLSTWNERSNISSRTPQKCVPLCVCVQCAPHSFSHKWIGERLSWSESFSFLLHLSAAQYLFVQSFCILKKYAKLLLLTARVCVCNVYVWNLVLKDFIVVAVLSVYNIDCMTS